MDFAFSEEQEMLRSSARDFLAARTPPERVVELAEAETAFDPAVYREMAELGWTGLSVPEEQGGSGMGFLEEAVLFEEMGRALTPGPFFTSVALARPALLGADELLARVAAGSPATLAWAEEGGPLRLAECDAVSCKAEPSGDEWTLSGEKHLVADLDAADFVVVVAATPEGSGLWAVDSPDARMVSTMDATRRFGVLTLDGVPAVLVAPPGAGREVLAGVRLRALAALALEAAGVGGKALELAAEHAKSRQQFGRPIGSYQAVSHQIASAYAEVEFARSMAYWAAWCVAQSDEQASVAAPAAKAVAAEAAVAACERSIQVHGGTGFTWEHILHRYYKRAQWIEAFDGYPSEQRADVAGWLLDR